MSNTSLLGSYGDNSGAGLMFRNVLINGDMRIWQRGASFTPTSLATIYTSDRWACYRPAFAAGLLASRQTASGLAGLPYALRVERSSGNAGTSNITANQSIESINMLHLIGQTVTLSFYARCGSAFSAASSILTSSFISGTGTDESLANTGYTGQATVDQTNTVTTSWQRFTHTYTVPSNANELTVQFRYTPTGTSAGNDWFEVTGIQLEAGPVATPFERRPIGTELALCQRYYYKSYRLAEVPGSTNSNITYLRYVEAACQYASIQFVFPVTMRIPPVGNVVVYNPITGATSSLRGDAGSFAALSTNPSEHGVTVYANNVTIGINVGISAHITASAEL